MTAARRLAPRRVAVSIAFAVAVLALVLAGCASGPVIEKGQPVPNFSGTTLNGTTVDLASLRGHPVVINFWGPTCGPCVEEMPLLAAKSAEHKASGVVILGVLTDDPVEPARAFAAEHGGSWDTVIDPGAAIKKAYHVVGRPQTYFVDGSGILRSIQVGPLTDADFERQLGLIAGGS
jgi:cytochrome c biogenesis protein CcmG/thiol:disulfide interchange protein DsbE